MLWIKRNLFLAVSGAIALVFLVAGGLYLYGSIQKNKEVQAQLEENKDYLKRLHGMDPFPDATNITALQAEVGRLSQTVTQAQQFFTSVPHEPVTGLAFKTVLDNTLAALRKKASEASVTLPDGYAFSFKTEQQALSLPDSSFPLLPAQLAEVAAVASIIFDAKVNALENIRRPKVTGDEASVGDYHNVHGKTNETAGYTMTPYEFTFFGFSSELAQIVKSLYASKHGFLVKDLAVEAITVTPGPGQKPNPNAPVVRQPPPTRPPQPNRSNPATGVPTPPAAGPSRAAVRPGVPASATGLDTVVNEKLLKITLWVYVVKPIVPAAAPVARSNR